MTPSAALRITLAVWLAALLAIVCYRVLTGQLSLNGLLTSQHGEFSPERLQLLALTIGGAATFATQSLTDHAIYEFPEHLLAPLLIGSNSIYLLGKMLRR